MSANFKSTYLGDFYMKYIRGLSSVTLVSFLSINSGAAMSKVPEQVPLPTSSAQTKPMIIANPFKLIQETIRTAEQLNQIRLREQRRQEEKRRQRELEATRRLEAERQQRYFDSLSPAQQQAYLAEQKQRDLQKTFLLLGIGSMLLGGSSSEPAPAQPSYEYYPVCGMVEGVYRCK